MNIRKFIITMVINIFLMYLVTILYEYINLTDRFSALEQTIDTAVESSVDASMGAEELFASSKREGTSETSYGVSKTSSTTDAFEKALKFSKVKTTKLKGMVFCWNDNQDPNSYSVIRSGNDRNIEEICLQEIRNAVCYVLEQKGALEKDDLIKEVSLLFGYKRLGKNVEARITECLLWAKSRGDIVFEDKKYRIV